MARTPPLKFSVELKGSFFTGNPVGMLHRNQYDVIEEVGTVAVEAAKERAPVSTMGSHRVTWKYIGFSRVVPSGSLRSSIAFRPKRASRYGAKFIGRGTVVQGAVPYNYVRIYGARASRKTRHMWRAAAVARAWVDGNRGRVGTLLIRGMK